MRARYMGVHVYGWARACAYTSRVDIRHLCGDDAQHGGRLEAAHDGLMHSRRGGHEEIRIPFLPLTSTSTSYTPIPIAASSPSSIVEGDAAAFQLRLQRHYDVLQAEVDIEVQRPQPLEAFDFRMPSESPHLIKVERWIQGRRNGQSAFKYACRIRYYSRL